MDLQELTLAMAQFMKAEKDFYDQHLKARRPKTDKEAEALLSLQRQLEVLRARTRQFGNIVAADPNLFDVIESWIVCVEGKGSVAKETLKSFEESADIDELIDRASNLGSSVKQFMRSAGYFICDMGAGAGGWDIGVRCTNKDSMDLCTVLHRKFRSAIDMGLLEISRKLGEHRLPGLYNYEDAERIIQIYGDTIL
jgi:hypothetical protein